MIIQEISVEEVMAIYDEHVAVGVLRDRSLLEGAVASPFVSFVGLDPYPTLAQKAGKLLETVQRVQAYSDGNKRLAWFSMLGLLEANGQTIEDVSPASVNTFVRSLPGMPRAEEIAALWVNNHMITLEP